MGRRRNKKKNQNRDSNLVKRDPNSQKEGDARGYSQEEVWTKNIYYDYFYKVRFIRFTTSYWKISHFPAQFGHRFQG